MALTLQEVRVPFTSRGIGLDDVPCYICGAKGLNHNIAAFLQSKNDGDVIQSWLKNQFLDYRPHEPKWIQMKIGACDEHLLNLQELNRVCHDDYITQKRIEDSKELPEALVASRFEKRVLEAVKDMKHWLQSSYCGYHIPEKTITDHQKEIAIIAAKIALVAEPIDYQKGRFKWGCTVAEIYRKIMELCSKDTYRENFLKELLQAWTFMVKMVYLQRLGEYADRTLHSHLKCACGTQEHFKYKEDPYFNRGLDHIDCKQCGAHFWYHGTWQERAKCEQCDGKGTYDTRGEKDLYCCQCHKSGTYWRIVFDPRERIGYWS